MRAEVRTYIHHTRVSSVQLNANGFPVMHYPKYLYSICMVYIRCVVTIQFFRYMTYGGVFNIKVRGMQAHMTIQLKDIHSTRLHIHTYT